MMQVRELGRVASPSAARICSGGCEHFEPLYEWGRKIAGTGVCGKNDCQAAVRVGTVCRWSAEGAPLIRVQDTLTAARRLV